jgi:hypothetical protein
VAEKIVFPWTERNKAMKIRDIMAILGVAVATMAIVVAFAAPERVDAVDQQDHDDSRITPLIGQPKLTLAGIDIRLTMDQSDYAPGEKPVILLEATNRTQRRVETSVWIGMTSSSPTSMLSRAPTMPTFIWSDQVRLALEPGETRQLRLETDTELAAGNTVSITLSDSDQKAVFARLLDLRARPLDQDGS